MKKNILFLLIIIGTFSLINLNAQINAYAKVTAINNTQTILDVSNVNQTYGSFLVNGKVIIYHAQGNVISGVGNNSNFGQIGTIGNTGRIEIAEIKTITYAGGVPNKIELKNSLTYVPEISSNSSIQIISYPEYTNYTTTANITALPWDGNIGGVVALRVIGKLYLNNNILADGAGFKGGAISSDNGDACNDKTFRGSDVGFAYKGESIYKRTSRNYQTAKGRITNGGGGGNVHNAGGGGGGNFSAGGDGGWGFECSAASAGLGGHSISNEILADIYIAYLGGGGGGGQQNNGSASSGANGGGLIFLIADTIIVTKPNILISADGNNALNNGGNDGAGGGGAGGSIIIDAKLIQVNTASSGYLTFSLHGGNGGNVMHKDSHGGGGGGGAGMIKHIFVDITNIAGVSVATLPGHEGLDNNTSKPRKTATQGITANGIIPYSNQSSLPVKMINQKVKCTSTGAIIEWATATEINNDYFEIQKTEDLKEWKFVNSIIGAGNSNNLNEYQIMDETLGEKVTYYRIKQVDKDGQYEYFDVLSILCKLGNSKLEIIGVNAGNFSLNIYFKTDGFEPVLASLYDLSGKLINTVTINQPTDGGNMVSFNTEIKNGLYIVTIDQNKNRVSKKIQIGK